jgi:hypothetical protein
MKPLTLQFVNAVIYLNKIFMNALSPWALSANADLAEASDILYTKTAGQFIFVVQVTDDSIWVNTTMPNGANSIFRAAYCPGGSLTVEETATIEDGLKLTLSSVSGRQHVSITILEDGDFPILRYVTTLTPALDLHVPYWPKDMLFSADKGGAEKTEGTVHASQFGTRTGFIYLTQTKPAAASILYVQNLTALSAYCEQTQTSAGDTVGGNWPELGFSLPPTNKPLKAGKEVTLTDAFVAFSADVVNQEAQIIKLYLNMLATIYRVLPKPETEYKNWMEVLDSGLKDLIDSPGCWSQVAGHKYFNAYVSDYETPPEIMVQLAVLLPLLDYVEWSKNELPVMKVIKDGLPAFYDENLKTIMRWLPAAEDKLKGEEEQKVPRVMDSWYLHHPLLNLSRLALKGDKIAEKLFLDSIDFAIKVAHHFKYKWPVFYKMDTLEVIKAETAAGKGGEKDVAGIFAHVMLQAFELTGQKKFLEEAEKAAQTLEGYGFELFYQANNTAFSAGALLRLYKITKNELYLNLSYTCLAGIFRNVQLWDCNYGYGKNFPKFFSLYPLNDSPYTAVYEEQEVFCALHDYLKHAEGVDILLSVKLLTAEYIRYLVDRAVYYYPTMLPAEMLEEKPKIGEVDPKLWIALEDLQDGWLKSGTVGQEVYGAGNAFGILPRHYLKVNGEEFMVYVDYPTSGFNAQKGKNIHFEILGEESCTCRLMVVKTGRTKLPEITLTLKGNHVITGKHVKDGNIEFAVTGNQKVDLSWSHGK